MSEIISSHTGVLGIEMSSLMESFFRPGVALGAIRIINHMHIEYVIKL